MSVPKRRFVSAIRFLQQNINSQSCIQTVIRFFTEKYKILKTVPKRAFVSSQRNIVIPVEGWTQVAIRIFHKEIQK